MCKMLLESAFVEVASSFVEVAASFVEVFVFARRCHMVCVGDRGYMLFLVPMWV